MSARSIAVRRMAASALALAAAGAVPPLHAQTCTVPGSHETIQEAIDDPACAAITLSAQTYTESIVVPRSLTLAGPGAGGAIVEGLVLVAGAGTVAALQNLRVENGCRPAALRTTSGARVTGDNLEVERTDALPCPLTADAVFADDFEDGTAGAWSSTSP